MEQLLEKDGEIDFFLMTAATYVNWQSSSTDIKRNQLVTVANAVNLNFETTLDSMDVRSVWAKLQARWETWVRTKHYMHSDNVDDSTWTLQISDFTWDQLFRVSLILFSVIATFSLLSVSFLDMFVAFFFFFFFNCLLLCIHVHA